MRPVAPQCGLASFPTYRSSREIHAPAPPIPTNLGSEVETP
jgi:hypothetical protein